MEKKITAKDIRNVYNFREMIELYAVRHFGRNFPVRDLLGFLKLFQKTADEITADELCEADLRFHEQAGTTLAAAISEARLALVAKHLTETDESIGRIARKLSFPNVNSLGNRFRARYGVSMREWRKR